MNRNTGIALLIAVAVLGGLAWYINANPDIAATPTPTTAVSTSRPLWLIDATQITGITVSDSASGKTFVADVDSTATWKISQPVVADADPAQMSSIITTIPALYITQEIADAPNLSQFGLESPAYAVEVRLLSGEPQRITVGQKAVTGNAYYVRLQGSPNPVLVSSATLDALLTLPSQPPILIPTEVPTAAEPLPTLPLPATQAP